MHVLPICVICVMSFVIFLSYVSDASSAFCPSILVVADIYCMRWTILPSPFCETFLPAALLWICVDDRLATNRPWGREGAVEGARDPSDEVASGRIVSLAGI
jgi:hypothetical protein